MTVSRILLLTRRNCTLCVEAEQVVAEVSERAGASVHVVDVDTDEMLRSTFNDHVPVTFVDGRLHGYWFVDASKLSDALAEEPRPMNNDWVPPSIPA